jgi:death-on-curing protein
MSEPLFLTLKEVLQILEQQLNRYGGAPGLRDPGGLESAVAHPQNVSFYGGGDLFDVAAAYAFHIVQAQAFLDGKKRTAIGAGLPFLELNNVSTTTATTELYEAMIGIAERRFTKMEFSVLLRRKFQS